MEISAINAVSPKEIDWRKLTAKEIIKYENQGVEVPDEYLEWAKSFQNDLAAADKDDTTYETAAAVASNARVQTQVDGTEQSDEAENTENLTAVQRRDKMLESGESYYKVAKAFSAESKVKAGESAVTAILLDAVGANSDSETETVESAISSLMAEADSLKTQIESLKNKTSKDDNLSNVAKILQLQRQLKQLGASGQSMAAATGADLSQYKSVIDSMEGIGTEAIDTGNVTVEMGEVIKKWHFLLNGVGRGIVKNGQKAVDAGEFVQQTSDETSRKNSENISQITKYQNEIQNKTGAEVVSFNDNDAQAKDAKNEGEEKDSQTSKTEENQQTAIASGNIDEIMKYKIRKGESINPELS